MKNILLSEEVQEFINSNLNSDVSELAFQKNKFQDIELSQILNQISSKQKCKTKLPTWFNTRQIYYPNKTSIEQTSSEKTALYKSGLIKGDSIIDLTGGFGVDDYYFSKKYKSVIHCEINTELSNIASHNFKLLGANNIRCVLGDSSTILKNLNQRFDCIYIDPSRRNDAKGKVFKYKDCLPDLTELLDFYFEYTNILIVKSSPLIDISAGISELKNVKSIHIIALENEVKELIWILDKAHSSQIEITTCNISKVSEDRFSFEYKKTASSEYSLPKKYIYEPNAAIMKSGGFDEIARAYKIYKLHQHSHLYTSEEQIEFPGRIFEIENNIEYNKKNIKLYLENTKANITTRNFPENVDAIRRKWNVKDGGTTFCFFTTDLNSNKIVLLCKKIK